jgi:hypothetical protein
MNIAAIIRIEIFIIEVIIRLQIITEALSITKGWICGKNTVINELINGAIRYPTTAPLIAAIRLI